MAYKVVRRAEPGIFLLENGRWLVNVKPYDDDGPRVRKTKATKAEARRYKNDLLAQAAKGEDVRLDKKDRRLLSELCDLWYEYRGHAIKSGDSRLSRLKHLVGLLGDPPLYRFTAERYLEFRKE